MKHLRDVVIATPADGEVLTYDSADEKWKNEAGGGGGGDLTDAVILAPASSARNRIQPTDPDAIGLTIRAPVGSFEAETWILRIEDEFGNIRTQIDTVGDYDIRLNDDVNFPGVFKILAGVHGYPIFLSQELGHLLRLFVGKKLSVVDSTNLNELFAIDEATGQVTIATSPLLLGSTAINFGTGSPEGSVAAPVGSLYLRSDGAGGTTLYVKESGAGDTGWTAISAGGGGAPTTATYITQTSDAGLSAEQALSALATGLVKNTTGTGVLSIGAQGTDYYEPGGTDVTLADGGTGASLADPGADRIVFWDDSLGAVTWLTPGTGLTITGTTLDAAGGSGGYPRNFKTGLYYLAPSSPTNTDSGVAQVLDRVLYVPFAVGEAVTADRIGASVTAFAATSVVRLGIYSSTDGQPDALVLDAGTIDASTNGFKEITISQALSANSLYWIAIVPQTAGCTLRASAIGAGSEWVGTTLLTADIRTANFQEAGVSGALPANATPLTGITQSPMARLRAA